MRNFWKWIRYLGGAIILVSLVVYLLFQGYYWLLNKRARAKLEDKPVLVVEDQQFRDLNANGILDVYEDSRQPIDARVENLLNQMTLEEKVGMFWHPPIGIGNRGRVLKKPAMLSPESTYHLLVNQKVRHVNLFEVPSAKFVARWNNRIQKIAERDRLGIPVTISSDPRNGVHNFLADNLLEGGYSKWPEPIGLAALNDSATTYRYAQVASHEMRSVGIRTALHPMADLATEPRWARINGTFGEDAQLAAAMTSLYIKGFQGNTLGPTSVACMTKHWPGGGPQQDGEDAHFEYGKNQAYPGNNFDYHLIPFKAAIDAGTAMMMPYYGVPVDQTDENVGMSFNSYVVTDLLRKDHAYDGVVCSDWGIIEGFSLAGFELVQPKHWGVDHLSNEDKIVKAINAGIDQFGGDNNGQELLNAVAIGKVSESRLDQSVRRLLKVKFQVGLFDNPYVDEDEAARIVGQASYMKEGSLAQSKAMVLLKNSNNILPLEEGIKIYLEGLDRESAANFANIVEIPEQADVALIRLSAPWEARDNNYAERFFHQGSLEFESHEIDRLTQIAERVPTIFFIYMDRPPVMPKIDHAAAAVVAEFGAFDQAVLKVAFGRVHPEGHLPFEIPSSMTAVDAQFEDVPYDSKNPLYNFGHGLTY
jgi:beta-glucosidase